MPGWRAVPPRIASMPRRRSCACGTQGPRWLSSCGWPPPGARDPPPPGASLMTLRLIRGGRPEHDQPGLLVVGAAEVVTMAGGLRMGAAQDDPALLLAPGGDPADPRGPAIACWDGRILGVGPRAELEKAL